MQLHSVVRKIKGFQPDATCTKCFGSGILTIAGKFVTRLGGEHWPCACLAMTVNVLMKGDK